MPIPQVLRLVYKLIVAPASIKDVAEALVVSVPASARPFRSAAPGYLHRHAKDPTVWEVSGRGKDVTWEDLGSLGPLSILVSIQST